MTSLHFPLQIFELYNLFREFMKKLREFNLSNSFHSLQLTSLHISIFFAQ